MFQIEIPHTLFNVRRQVLRRVGFTHITTLIAAITPLVPPFAGDATINTQDADIVNGTVLGLTCIAHFVNIIDEGYKLYRVRENYFSQSEMRLENERQAAQAKVNQTTDENEKIAALADLESKEKEINDLQSDKEAYEKVDTRYTLLTMSVSAVSWIVGAAGWATGLILIDDPIIKSAFLALMPLALDTWLTTDATRFSSEAEKLNKLARGETETDIREEPSIVSFLFTQFLVGPVDKSKKSDRANTTKLKEEMQEEPNSNNTPKSS